MTDATDGPGTRAAPRVRDLCEVLELDDPRCLDPGLSGGKAAGLAAARRHGLPALPGVVVTSGASTPALAAGMAALDTRGSGGARLAVMAFDPGADLVDAVTAAAGRLPAPLIVRSSARVEADGRWSGAFGSVAGVGHEELRTALLACWASAFAPGTLERLEAENLDATQIGFAALVQPEIDPEFGGTARLRPDGCVQVSGTAGSPAPLVAGWVPGSSATVAPDDQVLSDDQVRGDEGVPGDGALGLLGEDVLRSVAGMVRDTAAALGDTAVEWAWLDGRPVLLQSHGEPRDAPPAPPAAQDDPAFATPAALAVAALVHRFRHPVDEELVLPWALSEPTRDWSRADAEVLPLEKARALAAELAAHVWGVAPQQLAAQVRQTLRSLRGPRPAASLERIAGLGRLDGADDAASRLVATAAAHRSASRRGPGRWEPFLHAVVRAHGRAVHGTSAGTGVSAGPVVAVLDPHDPPVIPARSVLFAPRPVQGLAPLLWQSAAIVTTSGGAGAHLFEVARSLGVPAVVAPDLSGVLKEASRGPVGAILAAVDGEAGMVVTAVLDDRLAATARREST